MSSLASGLVAAIDRLLPQTQCRRCGYAACAPYAKAVAEGVAEINRCAPGGDATIEALAKLLGRSALPLDPECGPRVAPMVAVIDELRCIGCALCLRACPVDAILGAGKHMHTVIGDACTGCELCVEPCPVDCIRLVPAQAPPFSAAVSPAANPASERSTEARRRAEAARRRFQARQRRLQQQERAARDRQARRASNSKEKAAGVKRRAIAEALARARRA